MTLIICGILLHVGLDNTKLTNKSMAYLWNLGYGTVTSESILPLNLPGDSGQLAAVLIANSPQLVLSFLFLTYNGLFTCMLLASEFSDYGHERKTLRVTNPRAFQRSTYRLQLPYRYGIPLLVLSGVLHWLVSQSLFLARVVFYSQDGTEDTYASLSTVGYSCIAIITVICVGTLVVLLGILNGFRTYKIGMPLVGSCSAAISAACHRPDDDVDAPIKPVMWGVVDTQGDVDHCCFTSFEVRDEAAGAEESVKTHPNAMKKVAILCRRMVLAAVGATTIYFS